MLALHADLRLHLGMETTPSIRAETDKVWGRERKENQPVLRLKASHPRSHLTPGSWGPQHFKPPRSQPGSGRRCLSLYCHTGRSPGLSPAPPHPPHFTPSKDHLKSNVSQRDPGRGAVTNTGTCPSLLISHHDLQVMGRALKSHHSTAWVPIGGEGKPLLGGFSCSRQAAPPTLELGN